MPNSVEAFGGIEGKWDIPHLLRNALNPSWCFSFSAKLTPTAVNGGNWLLRIPSTATPYIYYWSISSDTAIEFMLGRAGGADPGWTAVGIPSLGQAGGTGAACTGEAQVAAPIAFVSQWSGGFVSANGTVDLLNKAWHGGIQGGSVYLKTAATAANVYVTMYFCEFTD